METVASNNTTPLSHQGVRYPGIYRRGAPALGPGSALSLHLAVSALLGFLIPAVFCISSGGRLAASALLTWGVAVYSGIQLTRLSLQEAYMPIQIQFWLFTYCWLGIASSVQLQTQTYPLPAAYTAAPENAMLVATLIVAGLAAFQLGLRSKTAITLEHVGARLTNPSFNRYCIVTLLCITLSTIAIALQGGLTGVLMFRGKTNFEVQPALKSTYLIEQTIQRTPPVVALLVTHYMLKRRLLRNWRKALTIAFEVFLVPFNLVANYLPALPRVVSGYILTSLAVLAITFRPKLRLTYTLSMIALLLLIFPYLDYFRSERGYSSSDIRNPVETLQQKGDYDAFQMISNIQVYAQEYGYDLGQHLLASACFFVPRSIWVNKPYGTGQTVGSQFGYRNTNLSAPLWGELYIAAGLPAVLLGFYLLAIIIKSIEGTKGLTKVANCLVIAHVAGFQIYLLRGDLMNALAFSLPGLVFLALYCLRAGKPRQT